MAKKQKPEEQGSLLQASAFFRDKGFRRQTNQLNNLLGDANMTVYGTDRNSSLDGLNKKFNDILKNDIGTLTKNDKNDFTSLLSQLTSNDRALEYNDAELTSQLNNINKEGFNGLSSFVENAYRNRLVKQSDLHEVASSLIELQAAIEATRNAIITSDVIDSKMSRTIKVDNIDKDEEDNTISVIEAMEEKFELQDKVKNFIIPKTLEYGEYYAYVVPYSKIFNDFVREREKSRKNQFIRESTLYESTCDVITKKGATTGVKGNSVTPKNSFIDDLWNEFVAIESSGSNSKSSKDNFGSIENKKAFTEDVQTILSNITVCNEGVPLPILEEGIDSLSSFDEMYMNESGDSAIADSLFTEAEKADRNKYKTFANVSKAEIDKASEGVSFINDIDKKKKKKDKDMNYDDVTDCYIKLIEPTKMIPVKIMNKVIGYYYVVAEDISPIGGMLSGSLYYSRFDEHRKETTIIDKIAEKVVMSFDKKFLMNNASFKQDIVECINYYNLNEKRLRFQYIPAEYIQEFKVNKDENGNGTSMIAKSLFYAKLYLMLLLFKIMSIILYSNDTKVNYVHTSGIDKNVAGRIQELARSKQERQINMYDLFNYSGIINKVGNGTEMYVPVGSSNERPIETEILSGQDIQLNTELLEMLKNAYIMGTGVPSTILNFLNEADFAKEIEQHNSRFLAGIVSYQLDFNRSITDLYRKIAKYSTNLPANIIENLDFVLQQPKSGSTSVKSELISNHNTLSDFLVKLYYGDNEEQDPKVAEKIKRFKLNFAKDQLQMLNFERIEELVEMSELDATEAMLKPDPSNGDNGDDLGIEQDMENIEV